MLISDLVQPAANEMVGRLEHEMRSALDAALPGWSLLDVRRRCRLERVAGLPFETLYLDDTPLLEIYPIQTEIERHEDRVVVRYTRNVRRLFTGGRQQWLIAMGTGPSRSS